MSLLTMVAVCWVGCVASATEEAVRVELKESAHISSRSVRLEDVAHITGPAQEVAALNGLALGAAPDPGLVRTISRSGILLAARRGGLDLGKDKMAGAQKVSVRATYRPLPKDEIVEAALQFVQKELGARADQRRIKIVAGPENTVQVMDSAGDTKYVPEWVGSPRDEGEVRIDVKLVQADETVGSGVVVLNLQRFGSALRLLRDLAVGEAPGPRDIAFTEVDANAAGGEPISELAQIEGAVARRGLAAGSILVAADFERPILVHKGDPVTLIFREGSLEVQMQGIATATGRSGEVVRVLNPVSAREVVAQLVGRSPLGGAIARVR